MSLMKKTIKFLLILIICSSLGRCVNKKKSSSEFSRNVYEFTIFQLNDVYEIAPIQNGNYGGMARVETIRKELLRENKNTLTVLAGDFLNPSLLGTIKVDGNRVRGKQMVEVMNAMNFDVVAFGNHEFDLSFSNLQKRINESNFDWISSNVLHQVNGKKRKFYKEKKNVKTDLKETFIKEFNFGKDQKLKVGFISVCIPSNPKNYVFYGNVYDEIKRSYNALKPKVDIVLGLTHLTIEQDKKVALMLPEIPLIMGGHEHTNSYDRVGNVIITKADANAKTAYIHRFKYDPKTHKVSFKSELKEISKDIALDKKVSTIVNKWQNLLKTKIKEVVNNPEEIIYTVNDSLEARDTPIRSIQTNMGDLITEAMSFAYKDKVDCALVNGGSIRIDDVLYGAINAIDIFKVLPYGGSILKVKLRGNLLLKVLDYGANASGTGAFLQKYNVKKQFDKWIINNQELIEDKEYMVAISDYLLKGFDIPFLNSKNKNVLNIYRPQKEEVASDIRKAVIMYLKNKRN